ncbi:acryloyl-CoA reductase [Burkholderia stagnalis]|nr:acryloyl-CoA reductase [Burkholderia stagnalis]KWI70305.1 acryloyl-CoA reductase [Burkholderia stagnalis]
MMSASRFKALMLKEADDGVAPSIEWLGVDDLPDGDVVVDVHYSSINYKDAMALANRGIIRTFPAIPGIDLAGVVATSADARFRPGDPVVLTGWGLGERRWGGFTQVERVNADWLVPLPPGLTLRQAMGIGTAGLTSMLCVLALEHHDVRPASGEILVTGASGGVGSLAIVILSQLGYRVVAMTGRPGHDSYLKSLGASRTIGRDDYVTPRKPGRHGMEPELFAGVVDTVGGPVLSTALARLSYGGCVAVCGLVGGIELETTVFPFLLRGVTVAGIDSVRCPTPRRVEAWQRLAQCVPGALLDGMIREVPLEQVVDAAGELAKGQGHGRTVVNLRAAP